MAKAGVSIALAKSARRFQDTSENKRDRHINSLAVVQVPQQMRPQQVVVPANKTPFVQLRLTMILPLLLLGFGCESPVLRTFILEIVSFAWDHMAHSARRVFQVASVAGVHVQMEVKDGLAGCFPDIDADIEPVRLVAGQNIVAGDIDCGHKLQPLLLGGIEPGWHMAPGDEEHVSGCNRKAVPVTDHKLSLIKNAARIGTAKGAGAGSHGFISCAAGSLSISRIPSIPRAMQPVQRQL